MTEGFYTLAKDEAYHGLMKASAPLRKKKFNFVCRDESQKVHLQLYTMTYFRTSKMMWPT